MVAAYVAFGEFYNVYVTNEIKNLILFEELCVYKLMHPGPLITLRPPFTGMT